MLPGTWCAMTDFETFWKAWKPRYIESSGKLVKLNKARARTAFTIACRVMPAGELIATAAKFCAAVDHRYIPDAFRWLKDGRYEDEIEDAKPALEAWARPLETWSDADYQECAATVVKHGEERAQRMFRYSREKIASVKARGLLQPRQVA